MPSPTLSAPLPFDDADDPQYADYRRLLSHPRVRESLQQNLAGLELQPADGEELIAQTYERLWHLRTDDDRPDNLPRMVALARTVFQGKLVDFFRHKAVVQARIKDAPTPRGEQPEPGRSGGRDQPNYVAELRPRRTITQETALATRQQLDFAYQVAAKVGLTDADVETMQAIDSDEMTIEEAAEMRGMKPATLRQRLKRIRDRINKAWKKHNIVRTPFTLMVLILLVLVVFAVMLGGARRNEPPPQRPPRTLEPRQPRGETPSILEAPAGDEKPAW